MPFRIVASLSGITRLFRTHGANVLWLLMEKVALLASAVIIGFWVVRTLGPEAYGAFSLALSIVTVLTALSTMGLETVVLRQLAAEPSQAAPLLKAALVLRLAGSAVQVLLCWVAARLLIPEQFTVSVIALILASAALFRAPDVIGLWLQNRGRYRHAVVVRLLTRAAADAFRIWLIVIGASVYAFASAFLVEAVASCLVFCWLGRDLLFQHEGSPTVPVRRLLHDGTPLVTSGIVAALYARIDQVILYPLMGAQATGHYAAAVRLSELFTIVATSIGTVATTHYGALAGLGHADFDRRLSRYFRAMTGAGLALSAALSAGAVPIVSLVYGPAFTPAAGVLRIHAWSVALVFASVALEPWFFHRRMLQYFVPKTVLAFGFAVPVVWLFTRWWGPAGTAGGVVLTYIVSVFGTNALLPPLRELWRFQWQALNPAGRHHEL